MSISFKSWPPNSSDQTSITNERIYEKRMAGSDGNGFFARISNPQKFTGEGEYLDRLANPGRYTSEERFRAQIADPYIVKPSKSKESGNLFDILF